MGQWQGGCLFRLPNLAILSQSPLSPNSQTPLRVSRGGLSLSESGFTGLKDFQDNYRITSCGAMEARVPLQIAQSGNPFTIAPVSELTVITFRIILIISCLNRDLVD